MNRAALKHLCPLTGRRYQAPEMRTDLATDGNMRGRDEAPVRCRANQSNLAHTSCRIQFHDKGIRLLADAVRRAVHWRATLNIQRRHDPL